MIIEWHCHAVADGHTKCPDIPWMDAKRSLGVTLLQETGGPAFTPEYIASQLSSVLALGEYWTDQYGVRHESSMDGLLFQIHAVASSQQQHGWTAYYAGDVPPDELIEGAPLYQGEETTMRS